MPGGRAAMLRFPLSVCFWGAGGRPPVAGGVWPPPHAGGVEPDPCVVPVPPVVDPPVPDWPPVSAGTSVTGPGTSGDDPSVVGVVSLLTPLSGVTVATGAPVPGAIGLATLGARTAPS